MTKATKKAARKTGAADRKATHKAAEHRDNPVVRLLGAVSEGADQPPLVAASLATVAVGAIGRRPAVLRCGVRMLAAHGLATGIKTVIKRSFDRSRPEKAMKDGKAKFEEGDSHDHELNSFPSGHTAGAVAIAQAISQDAPAASVPVKLVAGGVAVIQMPRGKHYVSDVLAGAAIGWVSERIASAALRRAEAALRHAVRRRRQP